MSNETAHCWDLEEDHGLGVVDSAAMEGAPDPNESEVL